MLVLMRGEVELKIFVVGAWGWWQKGGTPFFGVWDLERKNGQNHKTWFKIFA